MFATKEIFLFFLTNATGQCYFVDVHGNVNTCAPNDNRGVQWLPQAPEGWDQQSIGFQRNKTNWALNRQYTEPLKFVGDGARIIRWLCYTQQGSESAVFLTVLKYNKGAGIYDTYLPFVELDLSQVQDRVVGEVTVNAMEGGLLKVLKAYENTTFQVPLDGTLPENLVVNINGLVFQAQLDYQIVPAVFNQSGCIVPMVFGTEQGNDVGIFKGSPTQVFFNRGDGTAFNQLITTNPNYAFSSVNDLTNVTLSGAIRFTGNLANGCLVAWTSLNNFYPLINTCDVNRTPTGAIIGNEVYTVNVTIPTLAAGENVFIMMLTSDGSPAMSFATVDFFITFSSQFRDTTTVAMRPLDVLNNILKQACELAFQYPLTTIYQAQSNLLQQYSHMVLTSGSALRNEANATIKTSIGEFFKWCDASFCAGMGPIGIGSETLVVESREAFMDASSVTLDLGEVADVQLSTAADLIASELQFGYGEEKYDEKQGNNEYNTTLNMRGPVLRGSNVKYTQISPYTAAPNTIEFTRVLIPTSNTTNNKSDNKTFVINVNFSSIQTAQATVAAMLGSYYGSGYLLPNANQGQNRGPNMAWNSISGTGVAAEFSIQDGAAPLDKLVYGGTGDILNIAMSFSLTFRGDTSVHYFNNSGIFGQRNKTELLPPGSYGATFNLLKNGAPIYTQPMTLIGGKVQAFGFNAVFTNLVVGFGDYFQAQIVYDAGSVSDGHLFIFNVTAASLVITDDVTTPVFGVLKKNYDSSTFPNVDEAYNIEDTTPARLAMKHYGWLGLMYYFQKGKVVKFSSLDKNQVFSTTLDGVTISENADIPVGNLTAGAMGLPIRVKFTTQVPENAIDVFTGAINGHVQFTVNGLPFYFFPEKVTIKPALNDAQEWEGILSPLVDPTTLVDLSYTGFSNLNLMSLGAFTGHVDPIKRYPLGQQKSAAYNFLHLDEGWFQQQVGFWPFGGNYSQKWQTTDTLNLKFLTNGIGPVVDELIDCTGATILTINYEQVTDNTVPADLIVWRATQSLADVEPGRYWLKTTIGSGTAIIGFISEPQDVADLWPITHRFEYTDTDNKQAMPFEGGDWVPQFRCEGWIDEYDFVDDGTQYEDQPRNIVNIDSVPYETAMLNLGNEQSGVPPWVHRLVQRVMTLQQVKIDGKAFTRNKGAKWSKTKADGSPLIWPSLQIRETVVLDGVVNTTTGTLAGEDLTVAYWINTKAFGPGGTVVQVTKVL